MYSDPTALYYLKMLGAFMVMVIFTVMVTAKTAMMSMHRVHSRVLKALSHSPSVF